MTQMSEFLPLLKHYFEYDYRSAKTEKLLADLKRLRSPFISFSQKIGSDIYPEDWEDNTALESMKKAIKAELATREHIPNKAERKKERQLKAKQKK